MKRFPALLLLGLLTGLAQTVPGLPRTDVSLPVPMPAAVGSAPDPAASPPGRESVPATSRRAAFAVPRLWEYSAPLIGPEVRDREPSRAQKDPSVVFYAGQWHVFMTVKLPGRSAIEYCASMRWEDADASPRTILKVSDSDYYKAYLADRLDGPWMPVADTADRPFAGWKNIRPAPGVEPWTDNVSHGELVRDGWDETLTVDPENLRFVFQGMWEKDKSGNAYGEFPWRIGLLTPVSTSAGAE